MNRTPSSIGLALLVAAACFVAGLPQPARADNVDLIATPPELTAKVAPNVVLTFDDSGSMSWHHMPDNQPYRSSNTQWANGIPASSDISETTSSSFTADGAPYFCAGVIDPTLAPDPANPRTWSMNGTYYNPRAVYRPPLYADGTPFPDSKYTAAWQNGITAKRPVSPVSSPTTYDLSNTTKGKRFCGKMAGYYKYTGPALALDASGKLDATSVTRIYTSSNWAWVDLNGTGTAAEKTNFANWFSYYRTRTMAAVTATSRAYEPFDESIRVAWQTINDQTNAPWIAKGSTILSPFKGTTRTDFYNWLFKMPWKGNTPNQAAAVRVGELFTYGENQNNTKNPYWDPDTGRELSCRKNFHIQMTDGMWNNASSAVTRTDTKAIGTLPDGRSYSVTAPESRIFWNETTTAAGQNTMANIAFHYWATDLRPDFIGNPQKELKVSPYLVDRTTGITGATPLNPGDEWRDNDEVYWNPVNDPASWPHLVQFMIGFGVSGSIPKTDANYLRLRKGQITWPAMAGGGSYVGTNSPQKIDDMWHAAINSRGQFFAASNPDELIQALQDIIASVVAQSSASTPASVSLPILTGSDSGYQGGYDTTGWPGSLRRYAIDAGGSPGTLYWDAGCRLTGGACASPAGTNPTPDPNSRIIVTSNNGGPGGKAFRWSGGLTSAQQTALNAGGYGSQRVDHVRGIRTYEATGSTPQFRQRTSLLGAVINGEPAYVSSPRSGYHDMFPPGSREATAAASAADGSKSYAGYQNAQRSRRPMVYVGADDGMLHAFDADTGDEKWAFVPDTLIRNGRLAAMTAKNAGLVPGVDSKPRERDVFINGSWRTVLLGSLRLGGRGVYLLDVTNPTPGNEASAASASVLWEFNSGTTLSGVNDPPCSAGSRTCASLGYTYDSANIARLRKASAAVSGQQWVAVVSSGYFPKNKDAAAKPSDINEAAADRTSLLVIDLETGALIREIRTEEAFGAGGQTKPAGFRSWGLSTPMVFDEGSDEVDDIVYAGDLAGNLWRFDLSGKPVDWKVDLMFTTYRNGGAAEVGDQPIVFNPSALRDPVTRRPILVVGTGKYLGEEDRTSQIPEQAFYGVRDYGTRSGNYPIKVNQLITQTMTQNAADDSRRISGYTAPTGTVTGLPPMRVGGVDAGGNATVASVPANGWRMRLNIASEKGERAQRRAIPIPTLNVVGLYGLIPKSDDPCDPGARYSLMFIDAATGADIPVAGIPSGQGLIGSVIKSPAPPPEPAPARGGKQTISFPPGTNIPPAVRTKLEEALGKASIPWHRGAWRELLDW